MPQNTRVAGTVCFPCGTKLGGTVCHPGGRTLGGLKRRLLLGAGGGEGGLLRCPRRLRRKPRLLRRLGLGLCRRLGLGLCLGLGLGAWDLRQPRRRGYPPTIC